MDRWTGRYSPLEAGVLCVCFLPRSQPYAFETVMCPRENPWDTARHQPDTNSPSEYTSTDHSTTTGHHVTNTTTRWLPTSHHNPTNTRSPHSTRQLHRNPDSCVITTQQTMAATRPQRSNWPSPVTSPAITTRSPHDHHVHQQLRGH